jgi:hypothetical protein
MLTNDNFESERLNLDGVQRFYKFKGGWGLSLINALVAHAYPFAWEAAVLGPDGKIVYSTPLTEDVEVFQSDEEANKFIEKARRYFETKEETDVKVDSVSQ